MAIYFPYGVSHCGRSFHATPLGSPFEGADAKCEHMLLSVCSKGRVAKSTQSLLAGSPESSRIGRNTNMSTNSLNRFSCRGKTPGGAKKPPTSSVCSPMPEPDPAPILRLWCPVGQLSLLTPQLQACCLKTSVGTTTLTETSHPYASSFPTCTTPGQYVHSQLGER